MDRKLVSVIGVCEVYRERRAIGAAGGPSVRAHGFFVVSPHGDRRFPDRAGAERHAQAVTDYERSHGGANVSRTARKP